MTMRYTFFYKMPNEPYEFSEYPDEPGVAERLVAAARSQAVLTPEAAITVCDRYSDVALFLKEENREQVSYNFNLSGMFN